MNKTLRTLILMLVVAALATTCLAAESHPVVNINTADATQLALLPNVGAKVAQRIVDYRAEHGAFTKTSDLTEVKGIGAKSFERIASYVTVEGKTTLTTNIASPRKPRAKK